MSGSAQPAKPMPKCWEVLIQTFTLRSGTTQTPLPTALLLWQVRAEGHCSVIAPYFPPVPNGRSEPNPLGKVNDVSEPVLSCLDGQYFRL